MLMQPAFTTLFNTAIVVIVASFRVTRASDNRITRDADLRITR